MHRRHPVIGVVGEELIPLLEALLIEQPRLVLHEAHDVGDGGTRAHSEPEGDMNSRQARNWLRIEMSLVPFAVSSVAAVSAGSKLRCRLTHSLPCAARPSWIAR